MKRTKVVKSSVIGLVIGMILGAIGFTISLFFRPNHQGYWIDLRVLVPFVGGSLGGIAGLLIGFCVGIYQVFRLSQKP
jgi:hypothetical protein